MGFDHTADHKSDSRRSGRGQADGAITVVTGLPRSGTSMMMRMLEAGGMPVVTDHVRQADADNPNGYYELEEVKKIEQETGFLKGCRGRAVKIVSPLLQHLPGDYPYKLIFMLRPMPAILGSQKKMLTTRGEPEGTAGDARMTQYFEDHLEKTKAFLEGAENMDTVYLDYNHLLANAADVMSGMGAFLNRDLDIAKMARVVDPTLCHNG